MLSISGFIETQRARSAAKSERQLEGAVLRRDLYGPSHSGKQRRKDVSILKKKRPAALSDDQGNPFSPVTAGEITGFRADKKKKALPKYNATRPHG